jgi:hypothetical protein
LKIQIIENSFGHIKKSEMELSIDQKQIGLFLVSQIPAFPAADAARIMQMISTSEALQDLSDSATAIISSISLAITPIVPFAALIPIALFAIRFANGYRNSSNKNQGVEQLVRFQRVWTKLSEERREIISYAYDQSLRLVPGTTAKAFNTLFYGTESQFREKIENVQVKMQDLNERISQMQQIIEIEFKAIKDGLLREKGIITDPIQLGLKLDNGILKCRSELGIDKEDYVEVVVSDEYQGLQQEISKKLQTDKTVILTGLKGIGKSILARHVIYDLLKNGFEILSLDRIHESRVNDTLGESRDRIIIYDPLSPELYLQRREIQGTEYSGLDVRSIV